MLVNSITDHLEGGGGNRNVMPGMEGICGRVVGNEEGIGGNETVGRVPGIVGKDGWVVGNVGSGGIGPPGFGRVVGMFGMVGIDGIVVGSPGIVGVVVCSSCRAASQFWLPTEIVKTTARMKMLE
ncbi:hypothetical protein ACH5RR_027683 [Cinchona calisaya]|uniref:Uncharacterized protein n=1 Tax=Cinchona calisaya TaxID=153742 RepID=A0ABD2YPU5_9GENT